MPTRRIDSDISSRSQNALHGCRHSDMKIVLQAGKSLGCYFVTAYDFMFTYALTLREELQFVSRFRYLGRQDVGSTKNAWIQHGQFNQAISSSTRKILLLQRLRIALEKSLLRPDVCFTLLS
jgi:hypothetical protein